MSDSAPDTRPILLIPYMWIGDFVRCHTVVRVLKQRWPDRPVDMLATPLTAPLADYMPGVRQAIVSDLPRSRIAFARQRWLAMRLAEQGYGSALVMPRTWKAALAPSLAGIPERTGYFGEVRLGLLNDVRWGERRLPRMVDRCAALALPRGAPVGVEWPPPQLIVPQPEIEAWRKRRRLAGGRAVALAPGAVGPAKRWTVAGYSEAAAALARQGYDVWVLGGPGERRLAEEIVSGSGGVARDLTGEALRDAILGLAAATAAISNDSGLLHVAAALGTPTVGVFGPTSPWHWAPLNPLAGIVQAEAELPCRPCHKPVCRMQHHRCMTEIGARRVLDALEPALAPSAPMPASQGSPP